MSVERAITLVEEAMDVYDREGLDGNYSDAAAILDTLNDEQYNDASNMLVDYLDAHMRDTEASDAVDLLASAVDEILSDERILE